MSVPFLSHSCTVIGNIVSPQFLCMVVLHKIVLRDETEHEVRSARIDENGEFDWNYSL